MKRIVVTALVVLLLGLPSAVLAQDPSVNLRRTPTVQAVEKTKPAVVLITSTKKVREAVSLFPNDPFFRQFGTIQDVDRPSLGSGFIIHPDGYVVTNNHVIDRAEQIAIKLGDGREFTDVKVISADAKADLAILKISNPQPLPYLELGDTSDLMIGEPVIAVGNPLGYSHSVSTGIISAMHRDLQTAGRGPQLEDLIQTDAAINRGNSGGPLLNAYGQVIGINTAIIGDAQNIGFAIQVSRLRDLIPDLLNPAQVAKLDIPIKLKERRKVTPPSRLEATVLRADDDTPITTIAGIKPRDIVDAYAILLKQVGGKSFEVAFTGRPTVKVTPTVIVPPDPIAIARTRLGIGVVEVTPAFARQRELPVEGGIYVTEVLRDSPCGRVGVQPGDIVLRLGRAPTKSMNDFATLMQLLPSSGQVYILVIRVGPQGEIQQGQTMLQL